MREEISRWWSNFHIKSGEKKLASERFHIAGGIEFRLLICKKRRDGAIVRKASVAGSGDSSYILKEFELDQLSTVLQQALEDKSSSAIQQRAKQFSEEKDSRAKRIRLGFSYLCARIQPVIVSVFGLYLLMIFAHHFFSTPFLAPHLFPVLMASFAFVVLGQMVAGIGEKVLKEYRFFEKKGKGTVTLEWLRTMGIQIIVSIKRDMSTISFDIDDRETGRLISALERLRKQCEILKSQEAGEITHGA